MRLEMAILLLACMTACGGAPARKKDVGPDDTVSSGDTSTPKDGAGRQQTNGASPVPGSEPAAVEEADAGDIDIVDAGVPVPADNTGAVTCGFLAKVSNHLQHALSECPGSGDATIYTFDAASCEANLTQACTEAELALFRSIGDCDLQIVPCAEPSDRERVTSAIIACAESSSGLGQACLAALQP